MLQFLEDEGRRTFAYDQTVAVTVIGCDLRR